MSSEEEKEATRRIEELRQLRNEVNEDAVRSTKRIDELVGAFEGLQEGCRPAGDDWDASGIEKSLEEIRKEVGALSKEVDSGERGSSWWFPTVLAVLLAFSGLASFVMLFAIVFMHPQGDAFILDAPTALVIAVLAGVGGGLLYATACLVNAVDSRRLKR